MPTTSRVAAASLMQLPPSRSPPPSASEVRLRPRRLRLRCHPIPWRVARARYPTRDRRATCLPSRSIPETWLLARRGLPVCWNVFRRVEQGANRPLTPRQDRLLPGRRPPKRWSAVAQGGRYPPPCSARCARRSRASGENRFALFSTPFPQELEPHQNRGGIDAFFGPMPIRGVFR